MNRALERGRAFCERGEFEAAAAAFEHLLREHPACLEALHDLGVVRLRQGRLGEAEACFRRVLEVAPEAAESLNGLGVVLEAADRLAEARDCFARVAELRPGSADAHANLGSVLQAAGHFKTAAAAYRSALERDPRHERALTGLAVLLDVDGNYAAGLELSARLVDTPAAGPELRLVHSRLLKHAGRNHEAASRLQQLLSLPGLPRRAEQHARFALAGLLDAEGRYAEAFVEAARANAVDPPAFDAAACRGFVTRARQRFDRAAMASLPRGSNRSERPVFIVGMPRSGTTLVEQILASHPAVCAAGERNDILRLVAELGERARSSSASAPGAGEGGGDYLDILDAIGASNLDRFAERYLAGVPGAAGAKRVTDKMPTNFRHLGLIDLMLPGARVIQCRRDPLDTGLSCYMQAFSGPELAFASDLGHIGEYYLAYRDLMTHWHAVLRLPLLEVDYERLVDDAEAESRRMIEFLGLDWDDRCLRFHETARAINTASLSQVRRPLYRSAVGRHRHYARELKPLADALGLSASRGPDL